MENNKHTPLIRKWLADRSGAVTIEAAFVFGILIALCIGLLDYGLYLNRKGMTEAVSQSLVSVIRERKYLYGQDEKLTQANVSQLSQMAGVMLGEAGKSGFCLTVESITFSKNEKKTLDSSSIFYAGASGCKQQPLNELKTLGEMSPWSTRNRWIPLYQVTLSVPVPQGNFSALMEGVGILPEKVVVSSVALSR